MKFLEVAAACGIALACGGAAHALSLPGVPPLPVTLPGLPTIALGVSYGCPWITGNDADTNNTGYVDTQASYLISNIPVTPAAGAFIRVHGTYPKSRYFGFQTYDGFRFGNSIDTLPDAVIVPTSGAAVNPNPAVLPDSNGYTNQYTIEVHFEDPPAPPQARAQNVLYAGSGSSSGALAKQLLYRLYYPNTLGDKLGSVPLPDLTYVGPDGGEINLNTSSPDKSTCNFTKTAEMFNTLFPTVVLSQPQSKVAFRPVTGIKTSQVYPNRDSNYLRAQVGKSYGDMILVRQLAASTPVLPPVVVPSPDVRYWSVCTYSVLNSAVNGCIADTQMTLQSDGQFVTVISVPGKRPAMAYPAFGYNWLPFGDQELGLILVRQILSDPNFAGNYINSVNDPNSPVTDTLGIWAPLITYCDSATFAANAASGGQVVFDACKKAADSAALLGGALGGIIPSPAP